MTMWFVINLQLIFSRWDEMGVVFGINKENKRLMQTFDREVWREEVN
jgi:hypothetical protein